MTTTTLNAKRARTGNPNQLDAPYDIFSQPPLYKQLYPNVSGADRTFSIPVIFERAAGAGGLLTYDNLTVETALWPKTYDAKAHKAAYSVTQFMVTKTSVNNVATGTTTENQVFGVSTQKFPFLFNVRMTSETTAQSLRIQTGPNTANNQASSPEQEIHTVFIGESINTNITTFDPATANKNFIYNTVEKNFVPPQATWVAQYPPPGKLEFGMYQAATPTTPMSLNGACVVFVKLMVTLLD